MGTSSQNDIDGTCWLDANVRLSPQSVSAVAKADHGSKENGVAAGELDEATRPKAESRFYSYYQLYMDPDPNAQGPATFH